MPTTHTVDCNAGEKIQDKVAAARPGDTNTGGRDGIHLSGAASGASANIVGNTIRTTGRHGIHLDHTSVGRIGGNPIEDAHACGIDVAEMSVARVGCAARLT